MTESWTPHIPIWIWPLHFLLGFVVVLWPWAVYVVIGFLILCILMIRIDPGYGLAAFLGYSMGAEVLLRMAQVSIPWEFSKYCVLVIGCFLILIFVYKRRMFNKLPILIFSLLLPSFGVGWGSLSSLKIIFLMPMTLCIWLILPPDDFCPRLARVFLKWSLVPLLSMTAIGLLGLVYIGLNHGITQFAETAYRYRATTLSFGPNQVAWHFACGVLTSGWFFKETRKYSWLVLMGIFMISCGWCFSRGPFWLSACFSLYFLVKGSGLRVHSLIWLVLIIFVLFLPTGKRLRDVDFSDRFNNAKGDWVLFLKHPVLGVGPGLGAASRLQHSSSPLAHFEPLRLLGEHGLLGLMVLVLCGWFGFQRWMHHPELSLWWIFGLAYLCHSGFRTLIPWSVMMVIVSYSSARPEADDLVYG